jgi:hypothetical protein
MTATLLPNQLPGSVGFLLLHGDEAWRIAFERFDAGRRTNLADLVLAYLKAPEFVAQRARAPSPEELAAIAAIIAGEREPDGRGRKLKDRDPIEKRAAIARVTEIRAYRDKQIAEVREANRVGRRHPKKWTEEKIATEFDEAIAACAKGFKVEVDTLLAWAKPKGGRRPMRTK